VASIAGSKTRPRDSVARVIEGWTATRPDLDVSPIGVIARIFRLGAELQPRLDVILGRYGLRSADFAVLATLVRLGEPQISQARLGAELGLTPGTISVRVDRLDRAGLIARRRGADDQRQTLIGLTDKGRALFGACVHDHLANTRELLGALNANEREALAGLLGKLLGSLEGRRLRPGHRLEGAPRSNRAKEMEHESRNRRRRPDRRQRGDPAGTVGS
jgi:DNA-binding MarR family transcriptional regulator